MKSLRFILNTNLETADVCSSESVLLSNPMKTLVRLCFYFEGNVYAASIHTPKQ